MAKRKRRYKKAYSRMVEPMLDVMAVGITSQMVGASHATGATRSILGIVPTVQAAGALRRATKKNKWF